MSTGILFALLSAVLFGVSTPLAKILLGSVEPWMMAGLLYLGSGLGLAAVHLSRTVMGLPAAEAPLRQSDIPWLALVILSGGVAGPLLLMFGLARTDAADTGSFGLSLLFTFGQRGRRGAFRHRVLVCRSSRRERLSASRKESGD